MPPARGRHLDSRSPSDHHIERSKRRRLDSQEILARYQFIQDEFVPVTEDRRRNPSPESDYSYYDEESDERLAGRNGMRLYGDKQMVEPSSIDSRERDEKPILKSADDDLARYREI